MIDNRCLIFYVNREDISYAQTATKPQKCVYLVDMMRILNTYERKIKRLEKQLRELGAEPTE